MKKIYKISTITLICILAGIFLWDVSVYSFSFSKETLRVPMGERVHSRMKYAMNTNAIIVVGASGSGKTTFINQLLKRYPQIEVPMLTTTRPSRDGKIHIDEDAFEQKKTNGDLVMVRKSHGHWYGLDKEVMAGVSNKGGIPLLDTSSVTGLNLTRNIFCNARVILILPCSLETIQESSDHELAEILKHRIKGRGKIEEEELEHRLREGVAFLRQCGTIKYDYCIINDSLDGIHLKQQRFEEFIARQFSLSPVFSSQLLTSEAVNASL